MTKTCHKVERPTGVRNVIDSIPDFGSDFSLCHARDG